MVVGRAGAAGGGFGGAGAAGRKVLKEGVHRPGTSLWKRVNIIMLGRRSGRERTGRAPAVAGEGKAARSNGEN
jgi:hypothetical protein